MSDRLTDLQATWLLLHGGLRELRDNASPDVWYALVWQLHQWSSVEVRRLETTREGQKWAA